MDKYSFLGSLDVNMIEEMYNQYINDPQSVEEEWIKFFQGFDFGLESME